MLNYWTKSSTGSEFLQIMKIYHNEKYDFTWEKIWLLVHLPINLAETHRKVLKSSNLECTIWSKLLILGLFHSYTGVVTIYTAKPKIPDGNQMVRSIPFGTFRKKCAVVWGDPLFLRFSVFPVGPDVSRIFLRKTRQNGGQWGKRRWVRKLLEEHL